LDGASAGGSRRQAVLEGSISPGTPLRVAGGLHDSETLRRVFEPFFTTSLWAGELA
jgi:hypothetical protein